TSRSTVGTMTELNDHFKLLYARAAKLYCTGCGEPVTVDTAQEAAKKLGLEAPEGARLAVCFTVKVPENFSADEVRQHLSAQGYERILENDDDLADRLIVVADRMKHNKANHSRLIESLEAAFHRGADQASAYLLDRDNKPLQDWRFSASRHCPSCDIRFREPSPAMFSFNSPVGACGACRGFGRVMGIDYALVIPNQNLSIREGAIKPFQSDTNAICQRDLLKYGKRASFPLDTPWAQLSKEQKRWVIEGEADFDSNAWYGVQRFFNWLEGRAYKMHVRVMLSRYRSYTPCGSCGGARLVPESLAWRLGERDEASNTLTVNQRFQPVGHDCDSRQLPGLCLHDVMQLPIDRLLTFIQRLTLPASVREATEQLLEDILARVQYLHTAGVGYLSLDRQSRTLSGGEVQRINLTTALGTSLVNTLFVLDEPSIGLHPRDLDRINTILYRLRDAGNTLLVVEHDPQLMLAADRIIDMGPGPGERGGEIIFNGSPAKLLRSKKSRTAKYLSGQEKIETVRAASQPAPTTAWLRIEGAREHNLRSIDVDFPIGHLSCVTGVSGSGKSTLIHEVLYRGLMRLQGKATETPGACDAISGWEQFSEVILVDQTAIGKSARSNPASYTGAFNSIRAHFATLPLAKERGYTAGSFSFNSKQQKCPGCGGSGHEHVEMQFLSDVYLRCPDCQGRRYRDELLEVVDLGADDIGRNIADILDLTVQQALIHFAGHAKVLKALQTLCDVGLDYVTLGQPVPTLSGGEAQRLKLAAHLVSAKRDGPSLFLFDEPTTGLHFDDISRLMSALRSLQSAGHTLIIIEHNLDVIAAADWLIDLGPEGGEGGGQVLVAGSQSDLQLNPQSHTGKALAEQSSAVAKVAEAPAGYSARKKPKNEISICKANEHNLKDIDVQIPRDKLTVVTGVSGSGKSTLAFDIVFAEGQRRYLESLNAYARQFVQPTTPPDVDQVSGIPPTVAIEQRTSRGGQKSTVGTATEIHHFLRLLFVKLGRQHCPTCGSEISAQSMEEISSQLFKQHRGKSIQLFAPLVVARKGYYTDLAKWANSKGFAHLRVDGELFPTDNWPRLDRYTEHDIDLPVGELKIVPSAHQDVDELLESALGFGNGLVRVAAGKQEQLFSTTRSCSSCQTSFAELDPRLFSYNSRHGWCNTCFGTGLSLPETREEHASEDHHWLTTESQEPCPSCNGARLNPTALAVSYRERSLADFAQLSVSDAYRWFSKVKLSGREEKIARDLIAELSSRLGFLTQVGLGYLSLDRAAPTLSGGEAQRIRLAAQLGSQLRGVAYILDEPTIGLHPRDNDLLLDTLVQLRDKGNTVVVVEHDDTTIRRADHIIDIGPGAGTRGGHVVATGTLAKICRATQSQTGRMLSEPLQHPMDRPVLAEKSGELAIAGASLNNLRNIDLTVPLGQLVGVSGVSGSGKSTLVREVISHNVSTRVGQKKSRSKKPTFYGCKSIRGFDSITRVLEVDQTPIGKTPRSCPATYVGIWDAIRKLFAATTEASLRGYQASRFSFNTGAGRCPSCEGQGMTRVEMNFLPDVKVLCDDCHGARFDRETLSITWKGKNIGEVLAMPIDEAVGFFEAQPVIHHALELMQDVGLGYLTLGQHSPTLSGGEAQRLKLVTELSKARPSRDNPDGRRNKHNHTLYLLDEPTVGLHMADVEKLIRVLHRLVAIGHSVIVIEHNLDLLAECDWLVDMGPEAGEAGGRITAQGKPKTLSKRKRSLTGRYLADLFSVSSKS
ncbi:MAG: excinuclease ABC subunit UvrA, partial [Granulosicoccaceae bacterium]